MAPEEGGLGVVLKLKELLFDMVVRMYRAHSLAH